MVEIWEESAKFSTGQRLADLAKMIKKKVWFSDVEIQGLYGQITCEDYTQEELPKRAETQNTEPSITTPMLIQD